MRDKAITRNNDYDNDDIVHNHYDESYSLLDSLSYAPIKFVVCLGLLWP